MAQRYAIYLHLDILEVVPKHGAQRKQVMNFVRSLGEEPFRKGDFSGKDESLRPRQIKIAGDYAITYWVDHSIKRPWCIIVLRKAGIEKSAFAVGNLTEK